MRAENHLVKSSASMTYMTQGNWFIRWLLSTTYECSRHSSPGSYFTSEASLSLSQSQTSPKSIKLKIRMKYFHWHKKCKSFLWKFIFTSYCCPVWHSLSASSWWPASGPARGSWPGGPWRSRGRVWCPRDWWENRYSAICQWSPGLWWTRWCQWMCCKQECQNVSNSTFENNNVLQVAFCRLVLKLIYADPIAPGAQNDKVDQLNYQKHCFKLIIVCQYLMPWDMSCKTKLSFAHSCYMLREDQNNYFSLINLANTKFPWQLYWLC